MGTCVLQENWLGAGRRVEGKSYNFYDPAENRWHQTWVDNQGGFLMLSGGLVGDSMQMSGESSEGGESVRNRLTWTPLPDGRVRQLWEASANGGKSWRATFDGYYERRMPR